MMSTLIHEMFERQAERTPLHDAVRIHEESINYYELNQKSNQLARLISEIGCARGSRIGLIVGKGIESVIAMLGVLKSGGVFVHFDPRFPVDRLQGMVDSVQPTCFLVTTEHLASIRSYAAPVVVLNDRSSSVNSGEGNIYSLHDLTRFPTGNLNVHLQDGDTAHIYFTSGSTGVPKAVLSPHKVLGHLIQDLASRFEFAQTDVFSQLSVLTFDSSLRDIFIPITTGGCVAIPTDEDFADASALLQWIQKVGVTVLQCVPSVFIRLLNSIEQGNERIALPELRYILLAGENVKFLFLKRWASCVDNATQFINLYGTTETMVKSYYVVPHNASLHLTSVPIGRPVGKAELLIIKDERLCRANEAGELYLRTPYLSHGYMNEEEKTKAVFVQNPLHNHFTDIVYKTGDTAKYLHDGNVLLIGRNDYQVKIRGVRIEPEEIENCLIQYKDVRDAVVLPREFNDRTELVAFIASEADLDTNGIREYLVNRLPLSHIPYLIVLMSKLPLNNNNKVDRFLLANYNLENIRLEENRDLQTYYEPLVSIFRTVFGNNSIEIHDNFFDIGGDSLSAMQLVSKIRNELNVDIKLAHIFVYPTIKQLSTYVATAQTINDSSIPRITAGREVPASYAQQRLWMLSQMNESGAAYNISAAYRIEGPVNIEALKDSFVYLMNRHESLRTSFEFVNGMLLQKVHEQGHLHMDIRDRIDERLTESQLIGELSWEVSQRFVLSELPLWKVVVWRVGPQSHMFLFAMHHTISDGLSVEILIKEFHNYYREWIRGSKPLFSVLPVQYKDYSEWQRQLMRSESAIESLAYWKKQLACREVLTLPTDYSRPAVKAYAGESIEFELDSELIMRMRHFGINNNKSLFACLVACLKIMFFHKSQQRVITVGTPVSGRNRRELEHQVGLYGNTVVLVDELFDKDTYHSVLDRVSNTIISALEHQNYPFDKLVSDLNVKRDTSRNPLFDIMVVIQEVTSIRSLFEGMEWMPIQLPVSTSKFDITFMFIEQQDKQVRLKMEYSTNLFNRNTMILLYKDFTYLMSTLIDQPYKTIDHIEYKQNAKSLVQPQLINENVNAYRLDVPLHVLFEECVSRYPDRIAVYDKDKLYSYQEINRSANRMGAYLKRKGVQAGSIVCLLLERSADFIIGILGILKAGGAYLPLDDSYPIGRIETIIEDARVQFVITNPARAALLSNRIDVEYIDAQAEDIVQENHVNLDCKVKPSDAAYVLYTSGSTGKPKGVVVEHIGVVNYISWAIESYIGQRRGNFPLFTSISFDLTITSIFTPLLTGDSIKVINGSNIYAMLSEILSDKEIDIIKLTPSHLKIILQLYVEDINLFKGSEERQTVFIIGGENLRADDALLLRNIFPKSDIFNEYGPTEAVVGCMIYKVGDTLNGLSVPIGMPASNTTIYILNNELKPVPDGNVGEIYISRTGLAQGYLFQPELTEQRFIHNPSEPGVRFYKTGDFARVLPDGNIEYCGRMEDQIKLMGYRVEIGEIERALESHQAIRHAVVLQDNQAPDMLHAFLVTQSSSVPTDLSDFLLKKLPEYMIPSKYWEVKHIPLTSNGKVDKQNLIQLMTRSLRDQKLIQTAVSDAGFTQILLKVWKSVLGIEHIQQSDNFFDAGGTSIKAVQIIDQLKRNYGIDLPVVRIFMHPTIKALSDYLLLGRVEDQIVKVDVVAAKTAIGKINRIRNKGGREG